MDNLPPTPQIILSLLTLITTYLTYLVWTPPNPNKPISSTTSAPRDRLFPTQAKNAILIRQILVLLLGTYQSLLILFYSPSSSSSSSTNLQTICPNPSTLNPSLFQISLQSSIGLSLILIFAPLRLYAFRTLGPSFTFKLSPPPKLITTGIYTWVQHPSYTANFFVMVGNGILYVRPTSCLGCFLKTSWAESWIWYLFSLGMFVRFARGAMFRFEDEEAMLRETFGEEWEVWHRKTARFVPGLF